MPARKTSSTAKGSAKRRTLNPTGGMQPSDGKQPGGAPFNDQDIKRRLGNFEGAGEHALVGGRGAGIVGQSKQKNQTDKKSGIQKSGKGVTKAGAVKKGSATKKPNSRKSSK